MLVSNAIASGLLAALLLATTPVNAAGAGDEADRYALVIGNGAYDAAPLRNPPNDARDVARKLRRIGFEVQLELDLDRAAFDRALDDFFAAIADGDAVVLVFYAGHAVQLRDRNYLLPVDAHFDSVEDLRSATLPLQHVFDRLDGLGTHRNLLILDACRDNPFVDDEDEDLAELPAGLAPVEAPPGTLVAYATEPGSYAGDGRGRNGTYSKHLLRHLGEQKPVEDVFRRVRQGVVRETRGEQVPWEHSSLLESLYIHPRQNVRVPPVNVF
ncbi:MAG: caspase family protein [Pseudomonadales bacterium]|jgi:uncharacterized caspase-like protein|nr:caspase family protein [Pseudomonadales bacterium]